METVMFSDMGVKYNLEVSVAIFDAHIGDIGTFRFLIRQQLLIGNLNAENVVLGTNIIAHYLFVLYSHLDIVISKFGLEFLYVVLDFEGVSFIFFLGDANNQTL